MKINHISCGLAPNPASSRAHRRRRHFWVRALGAAALIAAAAGFACAQDVDALDPAAEIAQIDPPPLELEEDDFLDLGEELFDAPLDEVDALLLDAPPKPELGPEPEDWAAWRRAIDARLDRGVFANIAATLRAPDYLVPRGAGAADGVRDALSSFFAGGAPFNQRLVTPASPRRATPGALRPPPGPEGGTADELAGFFEGVAREAEQRSAPPSRPEMSRDAPPPRLEPIRPVSPPPAFAGPPPLRVAPPAPRAPAPPPRIVSPPPSGADEPALAEDLADFFSDS